MGNEQSGFAFTDVHNWVQSNASEPVPYSAVLGGHDIDGTPIHVGRALHGYENLPAKIIPSKGGAFVPWGGKEHLKRTYEVLVGKDFAWVSYNSNRIPTNAVGTGKTANGETLYVGRGLHSTSLAVGKIHPSHDCLYITFGDKEFRINDNFEILVKEESDQDNSMHGESSWENVYYEDPTWPTLAFIGGYDIDDASIFIGRLNYMGDWLTAKIIKARTRNKVYVPWGGSEIKVWCDHQVLVGQNYAWIPCENGRVPPNAVSTGKTKRGEPLYVGRCHYGESLTVGKIHPSNCCLFIPYDGKEIIIKAYEALVVKCPFKGKGCTRCVA